MGNSHNKNSATQSGGDEQKVEDAVSARVEDVVGSSVERPKLTEAEKELLKQSWHSLESDPTAVGIITFSRFFEANPEMKDKFKDLQEIQLTDMHKSQEIRQHAARMMGFVNRIVSRLDSDEKYLALMDELGGRHLTYGAKPKHLVLMGEQFILAIRPPLEEVDKWDEETAAVWKKLFKIISLSVPTAV